MSKLYLYKTLITWTGNKGIGTKSYKEYERSHTIIVEGKPMIETSSDPSFNGDANKYNPEELFLASLSSCHMLWYLHLCATKGIIVHEYKDQCTAEMKENKDGGGRFISLTLHPSVTVENREIIYNATILHVEANKKCFIANSCNFPVLHIPMISIKQ